MSAEELGARLRQVREMRGLSLKAASVIARISAAYLQKLEQGKVKEPSPNILFRLAGALDVPYEDLMELAGYVVPRSTKAGKASTNVLAQALKSSDLTDDEVEELARYLAWRRHNKTAGG